MDKTKEMKKSSFIEGTFIATIAIVITKILGMLYVIPFYATVGVKGGALYAYAYNIYVLFIDISTAGLPNAISKVVNEYNTLGKKEAKVRAYRLGSTLVRFIGITSFIVLFVFAKQIALLILGDLKGGNTIGDVTFVIRCISFSILVIPFLSVGRGYLQGHGVINVSSISQVIEQVGRILVIILGSYLALKVFHLSLRNAVGVAVFGAFIGGLLAATYVYRKIRSYKKDLDLDNKFEKADDISSKEIIIKIIKYAIPVVIISVSISIYNFIDMVLILRTINNIGYSAISTEFITSAISTWCSKINVIITAVGTGMTTSLIPTIVKSYTLNKWDEVNDTFNKALQIIFVVSIPLCVGIALLAKPVWCIFYAYNKMGVIILSLNIFVAFFLNTFMITNFTLQSVNKFKMVYISVFGGFITNALLDVPFMYLCHYIGIPAYFGAIFATMTGYSLSILSTVIYFKVKNDFHYGKTIKIMLKTLIPLSLMIASVLGLRMIISVNVYSKLSCIICCTICAIVGGFVYIFTAYKLKIFEEVFSKEYIKRIVKKLTFGKVSLD